MKRALLFCFVAFAAAGQSAPARGPLRILKSNPRYFTDDSGKVIYLAGTHNWNNFQDTGHRAGPGDPPPRLDYAWYLKFLESHYHNFFRLWRWESTRWHDNEPRCVAHARPHPWLRRINLTEMTPHDALASTQYCLPQPGFEYLVFQPGVRGEFTVNLNDAKGSFSVEWFDVNAGKTVPGKAVTGGERRIFQTPFPGPAALYLKRAGDPQ